MNSKNEDTVSVYDIRRQAHDLLQNVDEMIDASESGQQIQAHSELIREVTNELLALLERLGG